MDPIADVCQDRMFAARDTLEALVGCDLKELATVYGQLAKIPLFHQRHEYIHGRPDQ